MANEITWEIPKVDSQEVIEKLKGTTLRVDQIIFKMQTKKISGWEKEFFDFRKHR